MRTLIGIAAAGVLTTALIGTALAADTTTGTGMAAAPLSPGRPAGIKQAQYSGRTLFWIAGVGIIATGIVLLAENNHNNTTSSTSTSTTGTNP